MMDEKTLRAAANEIHTWWQDRPANCQPTTREIAALWLSDAYLAEHPADDEEPVTEAWLRSIGFDQHGLGGINRLIEPSKKGVDPIRIFVDFDVPGDAAISLTQGIGGKEKFNYVSLTPLPGRITRGDVRLLCKALGIELEVSVPT